MEIKTNCRLRRDSRMAQIAAIMVAAAVVIEFILFVRSLIFGHTGFLSILSILAMIAAAVLLFMAYAGRLPLMSAFIAVAVQGLFSMMFGVGVWNVLYFAAALFALLATMGIIKISLTAPESLHTKADGACLIAAGLFALFTLISMVRCFGIPSFLFVVINLLCVVGYYGGLALALFSSELAEGRGPGGDSRSSEQCGGEQSWSSQSGSREWSAESAARAGDGYCGMVKHILLLLFTFGVWYLIWIYRFTGYMNAAPRSQRQTPVNQLLLCMFVPFYAIYWIYKNAQRLDDLSDSRGVVSDMASLCLILGIFVPVVAVILMQDKLNAIIDAGTNERPGECGAGGGEYGQEPPRAETARNTVRESAPAADTAEQIAKFKELLDSGAITQEEYDAKKRQLLGL